MTRQTLRAKRGHPERSEGPHEVQQRRATRLLPACALIVGSVIAPVSPACAQESFPQASVVPASPKPAIVPTVAPAQTPAPSPNESLSPTSSPTRDVRISFAPPPLEGTLSLGIYDTAEKLVRVLHRESETDDFAIGHDALITTWDGKDDDGADLPVGKYDARGYAVGNLSVEGVDYFFNDWVTDEHSPHLVRIHDLACEGEMLRLEVQLTDGSTVDILYDFKRCPDRHGSASQLAPPVTCPTDRHPIGHRSD
jgi:hypothetical protein